MTIYVPSRSRADLLPKTLPTWEETGLPVALVVASDQADEYARKLHELDSLAYLRVLPDGTEGMGAIRQWILEDALEKELDAIVLCDDDHKLPMNTTLLTEFVTARPRRVVAGYLSIYGLFLSMKPDTGLHEHRGGMGQQVVAYCPRTIEKIGGYMTSLIAHEDVELHARLVTKGFGPWMIDSGVKCTMIGKKYQTGGIADIGDRDDIHQRDLEKLQQIYGEELVRPRRHKGRLFVNIKWKKVYERASAT